MSEKIRVSLWGMPGSGKTTLGKALAERLSITYYDLDELVLQRTGKSPSEWIEQDGESVFRIKESETLNYFLNNQQGSYVLSTGGGTVLKQENREKLLSLTKCVYLRCSVQTLEKRISGQNSRRPLLESSGEALHKILTSLLEKRKPFYACAHLSFDNDSSLKDEFVKKLMEKIKLV
ncbi:MAG: shikimate kinase [Bacteroidia bacterium]|nr:shikimate kinase [Bacteroidia bacterium]